MVIHRSATVFSLNVRMLSVVLVVFAAQESLWHTPPMMSYHTTSSNNLLLLLCVNIEVLDNKLQGINSDTS